MELRSKHDYKPRIRLIKILVLVGLAMTIAAIISVFFFIKYTSAPNQDDTSQDRQQSQQIEQPDASKSQYVLHDNIIATVFWVGEGADGTNDYIHNRSSAWVGDWVKYFGGIDSPDDRCGYRPCSFVPAENAFYFALPFSDYNNSGLKPANELVKIPWYNSDIKSGESVLKNRWVEIMYGDKKAYAQWEDVGPFGENDVDYVFGESRPREARAGIDLSPSTADYLGVDGRGTVSWRFIEFADVPDGPWKATITISNPQN